MEQGKRVRFSTKERPGETRAQRPGEQDVMSGSAEETKGAATRTGRRSAGLIRGEDERCRTDEASNIRKGKGKGNGGTGEHGEKGQAGRKGAPQVGNLVMKEDEAQQNVRTMKNEEEEEENWQDLRKMVVEMRKDEEEKEHEEQDDFGEWQYFDGKNEEKDEEAECGQYCSQWWQYIDDKGVQQGPFECCNGARPRCYQRIHKSVPVTREE